MTEINRREALASIVAMGVSAALPLGVEAAPENPISPKLAAARDAVQKVVDAFDVEQYIADSAQYARIFTRKPVELVSCADKEREAQINDELRRGVKFAQMRFGHSPHGQRYIFNVPHTEVGLGYAIASGENFEPASVDEAVRQAEETMRPLVNSFLQYREIRAADLFNRGWTFNPSIGGDGQALFSQYHPYDHGVWGNAVDLNLTQDAVQDGLLKIATTFVDEAGLKIVAMGKRLVVPVGRLIEAERLRTQLPDNVGDYFCWDWLTDSNNCFLLTSVSGLVFSEFQPLKLKVEADPITNNILVTGHEINGFGFSDPRAVFALGRYSHDADAMARRMLLDASAERGLA